MCKPPSPSSLRLPTVASRSARLGRFPAASWGNVQPVSFDLTPGHTIPVTVTVSVPPRDEPGERYVGIIFRVPAEPASANIAVSGAVGIQILVNVPGEVIRSIGV